MDNRNYSQEINNITVLKKNHRIFKGEVNGLLDVYFNIKTPDDFYPVHLNRSLLGVSSSKLNSGSSDYRFKFSCTSIYKLITEIEYIKMYAKYKELKINKIGIIIRFPSDIFIDPKLSIEDYYKALHQEIIDINRLIDLPRIFSGSLYGQYNIKFYDNEEERFFEGNYTSVYKLIAEWEDIRNSSALNKTPIRFINIELTDLDDSKVFYRENVMKRKDERAQREI